MYEVEIKVRISNPDEIKQKIRLHKGIYKTSLFHEDTYFNMPKGLRNFANTDEAFRIRKSEEIKEDSIGVSHKSKYFLTYKGRKIDKTTKTREEIEVKVSNFENMMQILKNLGFQEVLTVEKERELYEVIYLDQKIEFLIDYIPELKEYFMELEFIVETEDQIDQAREFLFKFLEALNVTRKESIRKSYLELILENKKRERKINF